MNAHSAQFIFENFLVERRRCDQGGRRSAV